MIRTQASQARFDGPSQVLGRKVLRGRAQNRRRQLLALESDHADDRTNDGFDTRDEFALRGQNIARFAGDDHLVAPSAKGLSEERLAFSLAVHVGGVEKVDACVKRRRKEVQVSGLFALEDASDARAAQTYLRNEKIRASKRAPIHPNYLSRHGELWQHASS